MFNKIKGLFSFAVIASINIPLQSYASYSEVFDIYEKAIASSALVRKIHEDGLERRQAEAQQLQSIIASISEDHTKDPENLREAVVQFLEQDKNTFEAVNQQLKKKEYKPGVKGATYQLLYNKMPIITEAALKLAKNPNVFFNILDGKLPAGYSIDAPACNYFPESDHIYSHGSRGNALKGLVLKIWQIQRDKAHLSELSPLFDPFWLDTSPFVHITPLTEDFDVSSIQFSPHFFNDSKTPQALLTIHNGYAFGGHRGEPRYPEGKKWGPQDCSSLVAHYSKCKHTFSTSHQAQYFQAENGFQFSYLGDNIVQLWEGSKPQRQADEYIKSMREILTPLSPNPDPQTLKPGLMHAERSYTNISNKPEIALSGTGGHTGIFLGTMGSAAETKALTISAARDLEDTGKEFVFGVEQRPLFSVPERMIMFFDIKG